MLGKMFRYVLHEICLGTVILMQNIFVSMLLQLLRVLFLFFQLLSLLMGISSYGRQNPKLSSVWLCQFLMSTGIFHHCDNETGQIIKSTYVNGWFLYSLSLTPLYTQCPFGWVHLNAMRFHSCCITSLSTLTFSLISCMFTCIAIFVHQKIYIQTHLPVC